MLGALSVSLNPYYTGIHLHLKKAVPLVTAKVLILIILEYIYIKKKQPNAKDCKKS